MTKTKLIILLGAGLLIINIALGWVYTETVEIPQNLTHDFGQSVRGTLDTKVTQVENTTLAMAGNVSAGPQNTTTPTLERAETLPEPKMTEPENGGNVSKPIENPVVAKPEEVKNLVQGTVTQNITAPPAASVTTSSEKQPAKPVEKTPEKVVEKTPEKPAANATSQNTTIAAKANTTTTATTAPSVEKTTPPAVKAQEKPTVTEPVKTEIKETPKPKEEPKQTASKGTITATKVSVSGNKIIFRIEADSPIKGRTTYMTNPDRVLLDVDGLWNVKTPVMPQNTYAKALRMGFQENSVRFVFDVNSSKFERTLVQISPQVLELQITFP